MIRSLAVGHLLLVFAHTSVCAQVAIDNARHARLLVSLQAASEIVVSSKSSNYTVDQDLITLADGPQVVPGFKVWRATLPSDHSHPYLLAARDSVILRLGGFAAPDVERVAAELRPRLLNGHTIALLSAKLAMLSDRNGAIQYVVPGVGAKTSGKTGLLANWASREPPSWPQDTVGHRSDGGWRCTITLLSRDVRSITQLWVAVAYSFQFGPEGQLQAWSLRAGAPFKHLAPVGSDSIEVAGIGDE